MHGKSNIKFSELPVSYLGCVCMSVVLEQIENRYLIFDLLLKSMLVIPKNGMGRECGRYV